MNHYESDDVHIFEHHNKNIILIGTAHISKKSAEIVKEVILTEKPDTVCIELDENRLDALLNKNKWDNLDLKTIIKQKQLTTLIINILLSSYQKKLGNKIGVNPGVELLEAYNIAKENNININLSDRDVKITLKRAWRKMSFFQKTKFISITIASIFTNEEISEKQLEKLKNKDILTELLTELGKEMPALKSVLIDERDSYLAEKIKNAPGNKIVAVVGAGHVQGIIKKIQNNEFVDFNKIIEIPKPSPFNKIVGWSIPVLIIGSIFFIGFEKGFGEAGNTALIWILASGIPAAIGTIIAYGHPYSVISVFFAAPITTLSPLIGAGYVAAFVQTYFKPPKVFEIQNVSNDLNKISNWWKNKLLRILLVFTFSSLGSALGAYIGAYKIFTNLF
ncbi:MAG: TraB/GumN family protein [Ignavibacteriae bacterium]|nr:TraB/GumN family protein [Ignavibacteriota bacterium]